MEKFLCNKGFICTPSPSDKNVLVPYFLSVRDKDIIWSEKDFPLDVINTFKTGEKQSKLLPVKELNFEFDGWNVSFYQNYTYTATKSISIGNSGLFDVDESRTLMVGNINLPFNTKFDSTSLSIHCTVNTDVEDLFTSILTTSYNNSNTIHAFKIRLKNICGKFINRITRDENYCNSYINIHVTGKYVN